MSPTDEKQKADSQYDPYTDARDLYRQEQETGKDAPVNAGIDQAEDYANDPANSSKNIDDVRGREETSQGLYRSDKSEQKETVSLGAIFKKKGPIIGITATLLGLGGLLTMLLSPALLIVQLSEIMTERYNDQLAALDLRSTALLKKKLGKTTTKGFCGTKLTIRCKYQTFGERQLKRLKKAGITPIPEEKNRLGRYKPTHFEYEGRRIAAGDLLNEARRDPGLLSALRHGYNPKFAAWSDKISGKARTKMGIRKASDVRPDADKEKMKEDLKRLSSGEIDGTGGKKLTKKTRDDGSVYYQDEETGRIYSEKDGQRINQLIDEINARGELADLVKKSAIKAGIKGALTSSALGAGAVDSFCTAWIMVRVAGFAAKIYQQRQLIRYAYEFMKFGSKVKAAAVSDKADQPTAEEAEFFGDILTSPNSEGKTATDSHGYKFAAYGDVFKTGEYKAAFNVDPKGSEEEKDAAAEKLALENETAKYVNGQLLPDNIMAELMRQVMGGGSTVEKVDDTCGFVKSWKGQALLIGLAIAGIFVGVITGGASFGGGLALQVGVSVALSVAFALLMPKLLAMAKGEVITGNENGNEAGNAIASGAGGLNAQASRTRGLAPMTRDDYMGYNDLTTDVAANYAEMERYERGPFDPTSRHTFLGSIVASLTPHLSNNQTTGTSLLGVSSFVSSSLGSIISPTSSALKSSKAMYSQCEDYEYEKWNLAADPFCNERYGVTPSTLDLDPYEVAEFMEQKDEDGNFIYIETNEVEEGELPVPKGEYKKYIAKCFDRETSFGDKFNDYVTGESDGDNKDKTGGEECVDGRGGTNERRNDIFRIFYIDTNVQDGMDSDFEVNGSQTGDEVNLNLTVATFNILHSGTQSESVWKARLTRSVDVIESNSLGVVGLQEARQDQQKALMTSNFLGDSYGKFPTANERPGFTPNAVIYDKSRFTLINNGSETFDIEYDNGNKIDHGVQVKLRDNSTGVEFYVINTHDPANVRPGSEAVNAQSRLDNARDYVERIKRLSSSSENTPIFLTGDFNSPYSSDKNSPHCTISDSGVIKDTWEIYKNISGCANNRVLGSSIDVDRIYMSPGGTVNKLWTAENGPEKNGSDGHDTIMADVSYSYGSEPDDGTRLTTDATFTFQNLGRSESSATDVFKKIKSSMSNRSNVVFNFAEIDEGDSGEHEALRAVFGSDGWSQFNTREPTLNRLDSSTWKMTGSSSVHLHDSAPKSYGCAGPARQLTISKFTHKESGGTKLATINTHFITHAYNDPPYNPGCQRLWDSAWSKLRATVADLHNGGYDVVVTGDFNRSGGYPNLHPKARQIIDVGPDTIFAIPGKDRKLTVKGKGVIDTPSGEGFHDNLWARLQFSGGGSATPDKGGWVWPVPSVKSLGILDYGERGSRGVHKGIDIGISGGGALGKTVVAAHSGTVNRIWGQSDACGTYISIKAEGTPYYAAYQHLSASGITVRAGDRVKAGEAIGKIGTQGGSSCGSSGFYHLHFSIESRPGMVSAYADPFPNGTIDPMKVLPKP